MDPGKSVHQLEQAKRVRIPANHDSHGIVVKNGWHVLLWEFVGGIRDQQTCFTNGTITNAWLPGRVQITFTGMNLLNLDGSDFHGIGVVPDILVTPTPQEFADGIDPELEAALDLLLQ